MAKPLPEWFSRAKTMKVYEIIVVETEAEKQHAILALLRKIEGARFKTRRIKSPAPEVGFTVERLPVKGKDVPLETGRK